MSESNSPIPGIKIVAIDAHGNEEEITDLYWFEENFVHSLSDGGFSGYKFRVEKEPESGVINDR